MVSDALLGQVGAGADYVAAGHSYYTAETHLRHLGEAKAGQHLTGTARILAHDDKRLHLWISITRDEDGVEIATLEQMLLHVNMAEGRACPAAPDVLARIKALADDAPWPDGAGRHVGQRAPR
jgi:carnitine 3-dehydrogenase